MPENVPEQFDRFTYDPTTQGWQQTDSPNLPTQSLEQVTDGAFFERGHNVYRASDSAYMGRVAYVSGAMIERGSRGSVLLNNVVPRSRVADPMSPNRQPRVVISGDLGHLGDSHSTPINRIISLAPQGELVYVNDAVASGKSRYQRMIAPAPGEPVPQRLVTGWRLATSEEMIVRGVAGWLARNATVAMERFKLDGMELPDGSLTTSGSEIVKALAANLSVTPVLTYVLGEAP